MAKMYKRDDGKETPYSYFSRVKNQLNKYGQIDSGYVNTCFIGVNKQPNAWDKAMYYFCSNNKYSNCWFLEEDVFIPNIHTIQYLDQKYKKCDILSADNKKFSSSRLNEWHWPRIKSHHGGTYFFTPPFYNTMACAIRLSQRMLLSVQDFSKQHKTLSFIEYFFNTLAMKKKI